MLYGFGLLDRIFEDRSPLLAVLLPLIGERGGVYNYFAYSIAALLPTVPTQVCVHNIAVQLHVLYGALSLAALLPRHQGHHFGRFRVQGID